MGCQLHAAADVIIGKFYDDSAQTHAPTAHAQAQPVDYLYKLGVHAMQWQTEFQISGGKEPAPPHALHITRLYFSILRR